MKKKYHYVVNRLTKPNKWFEKNDSLNFLLFPSCQQIFMKLLAFYIKQNLRNFEMKLAKNSLGARFYNVLVHALPPSFKSCQSSHHN
jgi:hypothetical protein